jgi:hypothetical protein
LLFKISADLTPEQKVAVSGIIQERDGSKTVKIRLDKLSAMAHLAKLLIWLIVGKSAGRVAGRLRWSTIGLGS